MLGFLALLKVIEVEVETASLKGEEHGEGSLVLIHAFDDVAVVADDAMVLYLEFV